MTGLMPGGASSRPSFVAMAPSPIVPELDSLGINKNQIHTDAFLRQIIHRILFSLWAPDLFRSTFILHFQQLCGIAPDHGNLLKAKPFYGKKDRTMLA